MAVEESGDAAEITHAREGYMKELVEECLHSFPAERHHGAYDRPLADFKIAQRFLGRTEHRFLPRDLPEAFGNVLMHLFAVHLGLIDADRDHHLLDTRERKRVLLSETRLQRFCNGSAEPVMEGSEGHQEV